MQMQATKTNAEYQVFAKLEEQNKDMIEIVKPITMSSYEPGTSIVSAGNYYHDYISIIMSGF